MLNLSRVLIGSYLWSIEGQTHKWRHYWQHFASLLTKQIESMKILIWPILFSLRSRPYYKRRRVRVFRPAGRFETSKWEVFLRVWTSLSVPDLLRASRCSRSPTFPRTKNTLAEGLMMRVCSQAKCCLANFLWSSSLHPMKHVFIPLKNNLAVREGNGTLFLENWSRVVQTLSQVARNPESCRPTFYHT